MIIHSQIIVADPLILNASPFSHSVRQAFHQIPGDGEFQLDPPWIREQINGASFCRMWLSLFVLDDPVKN